MSNDKIQGGSYEPLDGKASKLLKTDYRKVLRDAEIARMMPDDIGAALARARVKPKWCSEIRWRMELRRRKKPYGRVSP